MESLNRTALIVTPKRRFVEWADRLPDAERPLRSDEIHSLRTVYLIAAEGDLDLQELIDIYWEEIFEAFLEGWVTDESLWPTNRTPHTFRDWFGVEWIESVSDADPGEPITVREAARTQCAICGAELDANRIGVAYGAAIHRLTAGEVDSWEQALDAGGEPPVDADVLFRCCGPECAKQAEETLRQAKDEHARSTQELN